MKCPFRIRRIIKYKYGYNYSDNLSREGSEIREYFEECIKEKCPFYNNSHNGYCERANSEKVKYKNE